MSWLNSVRNVIPFVAKRETSDNLWIKCPGCQEMLFIKEFEDNLEVCPRCNFHGRIGADKRLSQLLDAGFDVLPQPSVKEDPLKFRDTKKYTDRLKQARAKNPHSDAFSVGSGAIEGRPAVVGVQDFAFMAGSLGLATAVGAKATVQGRFLRTPRIRKRWETTLAWNTGIEHDY